LFHVRQNEEEVPDGRQRCDLQTIFALLAAAVNLARLAVLGLARRSGTWTVTAG
jgi:hypothetical protein